MGSLGKPSSEEPRPSVAQSDAMLHTFDLGASDSEVSNADSQKSIHGSVNDGESDAEEEHVGDGSSEAGADKTGTDADSGAGGGKSSKNMKKKTEARATKPLKFGGLGEDASFYFESRANLAKFYEVTNIELDTLILENEEIQEIWAEYNTHYLGPLKAQAAAANKSIRARDQGLDLYIGMLASQEAQEAKTFSKPTKAQRKDWTTNDWYAWALQQYADELERVGIITDKKKVSAQNKWRWAHLLLKCKEITETYAEKKSKAMHALTKARQAVTTKKQKQDAEERSRRAQYSGIAPAQDEEEADKTKGNKASQKKPSSGRPKKSVRNDEAIPATPAFGSVKKDRRLEILRKEEAALAAEEDRDTDKVDLTTLADDELITEYEKQREVENRLSDKRRRALQEKNKRDMYECLKVMSSNKSASGAWAAIQKSMRTSVEQFFQDFEHVDVEEYSKRLLAELLDPRSISSENVAAAAHQEVLRTSDGSSNENKLAQAVGDNLIHQETAVVTRELRKEDSLDSENIYKINLPPPTEADRKAAKSWNDMINGSDFQRGELGKAMVRCYIADRKIKRVPHQSIGKSLRWWQVREKWISTSFIANKLLDYFRPLGL
jgi:hypothetical protein